MATLCVTPHAALIDVPTPTIGRPGCVAWRRRLPSNIFLSSRPKATCHTGTAEGANCVGADGVWSTIVGEVSIRALIHILTPNIGLMVSITWSDVTLCRHRIMLLMSPTDLCRRCSPSCPPCWCTRPWCLCSSSLCVWCWPSIH